jgi:hypothetical protein
MFKNRFLLLLGVLSLLLVTIAVSKPLSSATPSNTAGANDFYQRHVDWTSMNNQGVAAPVAAPANAFYQRHPEWTWANNHQSAVIPVIGNPDLSDYYLRHPELHAPAASGFSAEQIQREYVLGERYGVTPQSEAREKALREYWLGERYGQMP